MLNYPSAGPNMVSEYQVSGLPFTTSSGNTGKIIFPFVTQWVRLKSNVGTTTFGFTEGGLNSGNKFSVSASANPVPETFHWKLKEIWVSGSSYEIVAGLTTVPPEKMWDYVHPPAAGSQVNTASMPSYSKVFGYNGI